MAYFKFSNLMSEDKEIQLFNFGNQTRDYTHIMILQVNSTHN